MKFVGAKRNIAIVTSIFVRYDAISSSVRDSYNALSKNPAWDVTIFAGHSSRDDVPVRVVDSVGQLLLEDRFRSADLIIYHYGIYYALFDAILIGNGKARQVVRFHNVTPKSLVPKAHHDVIDRSLAQLRNIGRADRVWADSPYNRQYLIEQGYNASRVEVLSLIVDQPAVVDLAARIAEPLSILSVGRGVASKGLLDGIEVLHAVSDEFPETILTVIVNLGFSDRAYLDRCFERAKELGLGARIRFAPNASDEELAKAYHSAHVLLQPTLHEGFCVPIVEALRAGAIPVGYAAGNMPFITSGLGRLVETGDAASLEAALREVLKGLRLARSVPRTAPSLPLDGATLSLSAFDASRRAYVKQFELETIMQKYQSRVGQLVGGHEANDRLAIRAEFEVVADDVMRERTRTSLNRLPDPSDWLPGDRLTDLMREMNQPVCIHRKSWEYALCIKGLEDLGIINPKAVGLAVGAGSEAPLYWFANNINRMVATDLYDNPSHEGTPAMLSNPKAFAPIPYREDRLDVHRMGGDALEFPDGTFDFVFCLSSIEHFGSRAIQRKSMDEMARVLRPGGVACIITELILTHHSDKEYFRWEEIEEMFLKHPNVELVGGAPDLSISASQVTYPVDLTNSNFINRSPHTVLKRGEMLWTSFSMFLKRRETKVDGRKAFSRFETLAELNSVNDAQKSIFNEMVSTSGGELMKQREISYLSRWKEALVYIKSGANVLDIGGGGGGCQSKPCGMQY